MLRDFWVENFPIFPIRNVPKNVFKTLLLGAETIMEKYFQEIPETRVLSKSKWATRVPSTIHHHPLYKIFLKLKKADFIRKFEIKKVSLGEDRRPKEIKLGPRRGSPNGIPAPGDKI